MGKLLVLESLPGQSMCRVSRKALLIAHAAVMPCSIEEATAGSIVPGVVSNVTLDSVFVRFLGGFTGRAGSFRLALMPSHCPLLCDCAKTTLCCMQITVASHCVYIPATRPLTITRVGALLDAQKMHTASILTVVHTWLPRAKTFTHSNAFPTQCMSAVTHSTDMKLHGMLPGRLDAAGRHLCEQPCSPLQHRADGASSACGCGF